MIRKIFLIFLIFCAGKLLLIAQIQERIYLQTDKQLYLAGELLWLKLYTTDTAGRLMDCSKIGYVELVHDSIPEVQIKIDLQEGTGAGWMELPGLLPTGYYQMIAYTRYMRNEGESVFFERTIAIINPFHQNSELYADDTTIPFAYPSIENDHSALELSLDKPAYSIRDKGEIRIKGLPAENISLGVSITGVDPVLEVSAPIDALTVTNSPAVHGRFVPEYEGAIIDGVLIDLATGNPAADPQVITLLSFPGDEIQLFAGQVDTNGDVAFYTQCVTGKQELTTTAITSSASKYRVDIQSPFAIHTPVNLPLFNPDSTWQDYLQLRYLSLQVTHAYIADSLSKIKEITPCSDLRPNTRYILDDYTRFSNMQEVFIEFISFARIRRTNEGNRFSMANESFDAYSNNILVLLDNIPVADHELMVNYNPLLIKTIELYFGQYVFGGRRFDGIISFYSYKNDYPGITFGESTQIYDYEGTQPYRYFYTPSDDPASGSSPLPDFRHTLLWEPFIQSNGQNELIIPFKTSDLPGYYVITIEGIGENGTIVHATQMIGVDLPLETFVNIQPQINEVLPTKTAAVESVAIPVSDPPVSAPAVSDLTVSAPAVSATTPVTSSLSAIPSPVDTMSSQENITSTTGNVLAIFKINPGQRLTLIAEKYYGLKVFWVYLYEYNKEKIGSNPDRIPVGMEILVPTKEMYDIDATNAASVEKAKALERTIVSSR